jgi:hypothetical protein
MKGANGVTTVRTHHDLGYFDLEQKTLQPLDNPFGPRLSTISWVRSAVSPGWTAASW